MEGLATLYGPVLDHDFLSQLAEDVGTATVIEAMAIFEDDVPIRIAAMYSCFAEGEVQRLRREAHALAGAARNLGLVRFGETAYAIQRASEGGGVDADAVRDLALSAEQGLSALAGWKAEHRSG